MTAHDRHLISGLLMLGAASVAGCAASDDASSATTAAPNSPAGASSPGTATPTTTPLGSTGAQPGFGGTMAGSSSSTGETNGSAPATTGSSSTDNPATSTIQPPNPPSPDPAMSGATSGSDEPTNPSSSNAETGEGAVGESTDTASEASSDTPSVPTDCDESPPPAEVSAWVDESWNAQLGDNIANRQAWLLDSVMKGNGQLNLCVRWGATSAPSATVKAQVASSVQAWFNDWFHALGDYGCFPYGEGITAKVTGWAVRPGNEAWVSDLGPDVAIYTETDGEGEPKCPDVCSFFEHWNHEFPNCPGGEAFHSDYWVWVDDALPGGGGAAAVGGDWGLRMPVAAFVASLGRTGDSVIEHEMGHGFGFQDYYDWTGSTPQGGSLMIVGSQNKGEPTVGDTWLLRRAWLESKALRNW